MIKAVPFDFVFDYLPTGIILKKMFGMHYIYLGKRIMLIVRKSNNQPEWNGIWVATSKEYHESLKNNIAELGAFFLDGEDIIVTWEGDMIKNRYKVVRVGVNSVEMEDTQFKSTQTLQLQEDAVV